MFQETVDDCIFVPGIDPLLAPGCLSNHFGVELHGVESTGGEGEVHYGGFIYWLSVELELINTPAVRRIIFYV